MNFKKNIFILFSIVIIFTMHTVMAQQFLDRKVRAKLEIKISESTLSIQAKAEGLSKFDQSLRYELLVFSEDEKGNKNKNKQAGKFIINYQELKKLSSVTINVKSKKDRTIVLLLIKNLDDKLLSKSRKEYLGGVLLKKKTYKKIKLPKNDGIVMSGVVLDRTKTTPGRNFYRYFYELYSKYKFKDPRSITVEEKHDRGRNTRMEIKVEHKVIFKFFVQPKDDYLKMRANYAIRSLYNFFEKKEKNYIVKY